METLTKTDKPEPEIVDEIVEDDEPEILYALLIDEGVEADIIDRLDTERMSRDLSREQELNLMRIAKYLERMHDQMEPHHQHWIKQALQKIDCLLVSFGAFPV